MLYQEIGEAGGISAVNDVDGVIKKIVVLNTLK